MFSVSWVGIPELLAQYLVEWLDFLKRLDLIGEPRELSHLVASTVDSNVIGAVVLYVLPLAWGHEALATWRVAGGSW